MDYSRPAACSSPSIHVLGYYEVRLITPTPIALCSFSGYFCRASSACCRVLNGFESGVNSRPMYLYSNHCSVSLGMRIGWNRGDLRHIDAVLSTIAFGNGSLRPHQGLLRIASAK